MGNLPDWRADVLMLKFTRKLPDSFFLRSLYEDDEYDVSLGVVYVIMPELSKDFLVILSIGCEGS